MPIVLLDESLIVYVSYDQADQYYDDNICVSFFEACPEDEKLFRADATHIYLNPAQARHLAESLLKAASESDWKSID